MILEKIKRKYVSLKHNQRKVDELIDVNNYLSQLRTKILEINSKDELGTSSWEKNRMEVRRAILEDNINDFLNWSVIQKTMFYEAPKVEYIEVMKNESVANGIIESKIGTPKPYYLDSTTSGNLIHHAYSINKLLQKTSINDFDKVIEFGGGYGSMCRLFRNMNYLKKYVIFDLPEFSALQEFYLSSINIDYSKNTIFTSDMDELKDENLNTLFIATWSFSEMPLELRENLSSSLMFNYCVIAFQSEFDGINNIEYFEEFKNKYPTINFETTPIEHLPGHFYLIGSKKNR